MLSLTEKNLSYWIWNGLYMPEDFKMLGRDHLLNSIKCPAESKKCLAELKGFFVITAFNGSSSHTTYTKCVLLAKARIETAWGLGDWSDISMWVMRILLFLTFVRSSRLLLECVNVLTSSHISPLNKYIYWSLLGTAWTETMRWLCWKM